MNLHERMHILNKLVNFEEDLESIEKKLKLYYWDSDEPLVYLTLAKVKNILNKYINSELKGEDLEKWADLIECRDDIGYEIEHSDTIKDIIFILANATINGRIDIETVLEWIKKN